MHKPTKRNKEQVALWCRNGIPRQLIAESLDISYQTLMKYYKSQILSGETDATNQMAMTGRYSDIPRAVKLKALMFWLEKRGGQAWKPTAQIPYVKTIAEIKEEDVLKEALDPILFLTQEPRPYEKGESKYIDAPKK
ncbi:MAG: hypothetical protein QF858_02475 [Candidatus Pacebacteria bacterium]|nr:hypothetical protein [Candidatus Paceibacterota bacterium]